MHPFLSQIKNSSEKVNASTASLCRPWESATYALEEYVSHPRSSSGERAFRMSLVLPASLPVLALHQTSVGWYKPVCGFINIWFLWMTNAQQETLKSQHDISIGNIRTSLTQLCYHPFVQFVTSTRSRMSCTVQRIIDSPIMHPVSAKQFYNFLPSHAVPIFRKDSTRT